MTKPKKIPVMIDCARCSATIYRKNSCYWRMGRKGVRVCQACARALLGMMGPRS